MISKTFKCKSTTWGGYLWKNSMEVQVPWATEGCQASPGVKGACGQALFLDGSR